MDKFTYFEIRRDKQIHKDCKQGVYKEGFEYYKKHWPINNFFHIYINNNHFFNWDHSWIGCDNCVELWLRDDPSLRSKYGLDKNNEKMIKPEEHEKIVKEKEEVIQENKLLRQEDEKLKNEREKIMKENTLLVEKNQKLEEEREKITEENKVIKQEYQKLQNENETVIQKNNSLKHENLILKNENEVKSKENELLKQENQKLKLDLNNQKNSIQNFVSSLESGLNHHSFQVLNQLNNIIEQIKEINLKEIRNIKISEECCLSDKDNLVDFICSVCLDIVEKPVSCSKCEALNCRECIDFDKACPICRVGDVFIEANLPRLVKNTLSNLKISCPLGCLQQFKYEFKEKHFSECTNKDKIPSKCSLCNMTLQEDLPTHSKHCDKLKTRCPFCKVEMSKLELEEHSKACKSFIKPCEVCMVAFPSIFHKAHTDYYCSKIVALKQKIKNFIQSI